LKVAIVGVGLIGGSIGLASRLLANAEVRGYDPDEGVRARAVELGAIDAQAGDIATAVDGADVVFVAAPVGALAEAVRLSLAAAGPSCVVSDVGSTKRLLVAAGVDRRFVGGHPLAGAETAGVEHARADLFDGATWYLTPAQERTGESMYERLSSLLRRFGASPTAIDADTHDRLMARVSHLPHVLANLLVSQAASMLHGDESQRIPAFGPSFRDATRVAGANSAIWTDIYISNKDALIDAIDAFAAGLQEMRCWLVERQAAEVTAWNEQARANREKLLNIGLLGGAGGEAVLELRVLVPNHPGVVAAIALALGHAGVNIADMALSPSADDHQGVIALWVRGEQHAKRAVELIAGLGFSVVRA
jgi:prephenate dehydrogenase